MAEEFDFISPTDRPALLAISTGEWLDQTKTALLDLGYKVHAVETHAQFHTRYNQINYQVIVIEEMFAGSAPSENASLQTIQQMPMGQRRHAVFLLIGDSFETLNNLQAFANSVHCVVNYSEMPLIGQLIQKAVADNQLFLGTYRDTMQRLAQKGA